MSNINNSINEKINQNCSSISLEESNEPNKDNTISNSSLSVQQNLLDGQESNGKINDNIISLLAPDNFKNFIFYFFKNDEQADIKSKIIFVSLLNSCKNYFDDDLMKLFNEEECTLIMLNWVYKNKSFFKNPLVGGPINFELLNLFHSILIFYDSINIEPRDILNLKLYEKLNKLKNIINYYININFINLINKILNKWKKIVEDFYEKQYITNYKINKLGLKRNREDQDTEADSTDLNYINNINNKTNINKPIKKQFKVSFNLNNNEILYFNKDDVPKQISLDKNKSVKLN